MARLLNRLTFLRNINQLYKFYSKKPSVILGIESSCDDTGCGIVNSDGILLGDAINSQQLIHLRNGGIIPPVAQHLHRQYMEPVVNEALNKSGLSFDNIDAIAVTTKPGLALSLGVGLKYAKHLSRKYAKPIIPIHHMEAHALMARMENKIEYPFLVLLISGGHSIITIAKDVDEFHVLGDSIQDSPGEAFDKVARRAKLKNNPLFSKLSGGQAIELAASMSKNPHYFTIPDTMMNYKNCMFSYSGIKSATTRFIQISENMHGIVADGITPDIYDICFGFQMAIAKHMCHRIQRAMEYIELTNLIPNDKKTLVVSGGVACNNFIINALDIVCKHLDYKLIRPRPKLCTDNGIMIAWNGVEKYDKGIGIENVNNISKIDIDSKCKFGIDRSKDVTEMNIKCKWVQLTKLYNLNEEKSSNKIENIIS